MRVMTIVGARPGFIKEAPVNRALRQKHEVVLVHTGQHYDPGMSDVFFEQLGIPAPDYHLGVGALPNVDQVGGMLLKLRPIVETVKPGWIIVYGDTNSTLAGALGGGMLQVPVAHVEAGLRSFNREMPEENNRILTDHISAALFCPTVAAVENLANEGVRDHVYLIGDVMIDALLQNRDRGSAAVLTELGLDAGGYDLATIHRASNTDDPAALSAIMAGFTALGTPIVLPTHPRLRKALATHQIAPAPNARLIDPVGYLEMIALMSHARLILTDSGGIQKEAYALEKPCVTLREDTEWVETVEYGWNRLVGADMERIVDGVRAALSTVPQDHPRVYGDGHASDRIVEVLTELHAQGHRL